MEDEENNEIKKDEEELQLKKQNEELNKKIIELNYELKNEKEKNNSILDEKNILKEENIIS